jgi:hypothetical protein
VADAGAASSKGPGAGEGEGGREQQKSSPESRRVGKRARSRSVQGRTGGAYRESLSLGERPRAPWHPLPLSELLILVGAIGVLVGLGRPLLAGIAAVLIGTVEVTLREHLSGYRSHTLILALLAVIVLDTPLVLVVTPFTSLMKVGLLLVDAALGTLLYKLLRTRYLDARRERTFAGRH